MAGSPDSIARMVLRLALVCSCAGVAFQILIYGGPVFSWLWLELDWSEAAAMRLERAGAFALLACIPFLFARRAWVVALPVAGWLALTALAETLIGTWHPGLIPGAHAARYLAPLALVALSLAPAKRQSAEWLLRVGAGLTFIFHGVQALLGKAEFIDFIISAGGKVLLLEASEPSVSAALVIVGVMDIAVGAAILLPARLRPVAMYMAFWGLLTAALRVLYMGLDFLPDALMRVTNGAVPLTLAVLWTKGKRYEVAP
jgi:uncharacterized membrane protein YphA (DoxX/SURF4 family)